jgi:hypothetical protein
MSLIHRRPLTALELAARRRNARKSTGPRTPAGKFRSSLNALKYAPLPPVLTEMIQFQGEDIREYRRLHRDLIALFLPQNSAQNECVTELAEAWWEKIRALHAPDREGFRRDNIRAADKRLEAGLRSLIGALRIGSRKWRYVLELSVGGRFNSLAGMRRRIEAQLDVVTRAAHDAESQAGAGSNCSPFNRGQGEAEKSLKTNDLHKLSVKTNRSRISQVESAT